MSVVTKYRIAFNKLKSEKTGVISFESIIKEAGGKGKSAIKRGRSREFDELHSEITAYNQDKRIKLKKKDIAINKKNKKIKKLESVIDSLTNQNLMLLESLERFERQERSVLSLK